jgi:nicotinamidase-related amidase
VAERGEAEVFLKGSDVGSRILHLPPMPANPIAKRCESTEQACMTQLPQSTALIVIDVQQAFLDPRWGERNNPDAESNIARLLAAWRGSGRPIRHVVHDSVEPNSLLRPDSGGNAIQAAAAPEGTEPVYHKHVNSAFIGTSLESDLRQDGIDTLVIVGLTTNHCVSTTARMAGNLGFSTYVVSDATATFARLALDGTLRPAEAVHSAALSDLHEEFATVADTAEILKRTGSMT